ncbi:MAG: outer membrane protein assembly factor BamD [Bacteroidales bacterium]|nr:outer membrane protein assembly factor BamD [Bacteroidales bacterium]
MRTAKILLAFGIGACLMLSGCKSQYEKLLEGNDSEAKYKAAFEYFNKGKFKKSADLFESLSVISTGTMRDDTVQFYWGMSNYRYKDYYTAETNFKNFVAKFPRSSFTEEASFLRIDCLYRATLRYELDQSPTYSAIVAINEYKMAYPETVHRDVCDRILLELRERLDTKAYQNAYIYYKMEDYKAARVALKNVLKDNSDNMHREEILYYTAMASYKYADMSIPSKQKERYMLFVDDYFNFIGEYPDSPKRKELERLYKKAKEKI